MKPSGEEERGQLRAHKNIHVKLMLTSLSAMAAETSTFPIDLTKTRLQLESRSRSRTNAFRVASEIVREQGPLGLYKGLSPAILRHLLYTPIRIVAYENLRNAVVSADGGGGGGGSLSLSAKALAGGFSGVIAQCR
nr:mitochondrial uncoupling protein 3 [Quercus suber]